MNRYIWTVQDQVLNMLECVDGILKVSCSELESAYEIDEIIDIRERLGRVRDRVRVRNSLNALPWEEWEE